jgi:hypothetical protein
VTLTRLLLLLAGRNRERAQAPAVPEE